ncbi:hypothetical protein Y900_002595 [Mycolicibacterium aromaticivorans JS19b1 = JCM 16368]|uniref:Uncharacterized protein n=1 Tax=Mycolicibacterium aromaticivorans JS19b1 = JCM 16368 TaxID=1440774 RepID=A0A064CB76_9MYCO|nr:hypothetical protein [Mycolicibacterium aromaticivorans]KDE97854.1 hypothetical protein Y900_002595 [Mycolicibacterium aromaticivorans JS19b1 = JCM 16368]
MLSAVVLTPSAPVLVPELAGAAAAEVADFRDAALKAAAALPDLWVAIGVGAADQTIEADTRGTFAGYGVEVPVALSPDAAPAVRGLPLCALFTGWLRGQASPAARAQVRVYDADHDADRALEFGRLLRAEIDATDDPVGVLVVADGANTLTPPAPGGYDPAATAAQAALDDALASGDSAALAGLPGGIVGRVAYQVLAGLVGSGPQEATELVRGAPYGVGYFVGTWHAAEGRSAATRESA